MPVSAVTCEIVKRFWSRNFAARNLHELHGNGAALLAAV